MFCSICKRIEFEFDETKRRICDSGHIFCVICDTESCDCRICGAGVVNWIYVRKNLKLKLLSKFNENFNFRLIFMKISHVFKFLQSMALMIHLKMRKLMKQSPQIIPMTA